GEPAEDFAGKLILHLAGERGEALLAEPVDEKGVGAADEGEGRFGHGAAYSAPTARVAHARPARMAGRTMCTRKSDVPAAGATNLGTTVLTVAGWRCFSVGQRHGDARPDGRGCRIVAS